MAAGAFDHQDLPFEQVVDELRPQRGLAGNPLFQVLFNMYNFPVHELRLAGTTARRLVAPVPGSLFDLTLYAQEAPAGLRFEAVYNRDLFAPPRLAELLRQMRGLLEQVTADPGAPIASHSLRTAGPVGLPDPAQPLHRGEARVVTSVVRDRAALAPDGIAVVSPEGSVRRGQLVAAAGRLAHWLDDAGVGREDVVAIHGPRTPGLVVALLGVLEAEAGFVVLD